MARDQPIEITAAPEISVGPIVIRFGLVEAHAKKSPVPAEDGNGSPLEAMPPAGLARLKPEAIPPGGEDPFHQLIPYIEAYRAAWGAVYRVIYDHLTRLPPELRTNYIKRVGVEHPAVNVENDFQRIAHYYGVIRESSGR